MELKIIALFTQPANKTQQTYLAVIIFFVLICLACGYLLKFSPPIFNFDDSYIVLHNAQVLHLGYDRNYLHVPALTGTTSLIHLALIAFFMFWLPPIWASMVVAWLAIFAYAFGLLRLAFVFSASVAQAFLFVLAGVLIPQVIFHFLSGLETGLTMAALVWACVFLTEPNKGAARVLRCLFAGLLPFLRPELAIFSFLIVARQAWDYWQQRQTLNYLLRNITYDGLLVLLAALPWLCWYYIDLGTFYPETFAAKLAIFAEVHQPLAQKLRFVFAAIVRFGWKIGWLGFLGMLLLMLLTPVGRMGLVFFCGFLGFYALYFPSFLNFNLQRYLYICLPFLLYGVISCVRHKDKFIRYTVNSLLIIILLQGLWWLSSCWNYYLLARDFHAKEFPAFTQWCIKNIPANDVILVQDAGYIAYATHFHLIDMVGLKTPAVIAYHRNVTMPSNGKLRIQANTAIISAMHPHYLIIVKEWEDVFHITQGLRELGWHLQLLRWGVQTYWVYQIN